MSKSSDLTRLSKELRQEAQRQGWRVNVTGSGHYRLLSPDGQTIVILQATPTDYRGMRNTISAMRRGGFRWQGR